jgi:tetratricopeptide (TPR) repeat protein
MNRHEKKFSSIPDSDNEISLCMIVKDEEDFLPRCLKSAEILVDEMVIVDTGSTDRTLEIASQFGARIYHHPWEDDYSKHRNQSLSYATKGWILVLDADEVIAQRDVQNIKSLIRTIQADGFFLTLRNYERTLNLANITANCNDYEEGMDYPGFIPVDLIRLFKKDQDIFFSGKVHETVIQSFETSKKYAYRSNIPIHHYGKTREDRIYKKQLLYLKLGEERLKNNPSDLTAYKGLADQYLELGIPDKALHISELGLARFPDAEVLHFNRGLALDRLNRHDEAEAEYLTVLTNDPGHLGACHNLALIFFQKHYYEKALDVLEKGLIKGLSHPAVFCILGQVYDALEHWDKSLHAFDRAITVQHNYPNANYYRAVLFIKRNLLSDAIGALEREIEIGGNVVAAYNLLGQISLTFGDQQSAVQFFQKVLSIIPDDPTAVRYLQTIKHH